MWSRSILFPFILEFLSLFPLFLDFIAVSGCVLDNTDNYSTRACWISANYNHFGATDLVGHGYPARPRCTQICVYPRAFMTLRVVQFSLKIAHLCLSMGPRGPRAYGLRPRLWLLPTILSVNHSYFISSPLACLNLNSKQLYHISN